MDRSKFLSKVIGLYLIIVSAAILTNMQQFITQVNNLVNNAPLMFMTGFCTTIIGLLMVVSHNIWQLSWRFIITFIAWVTLIKGVSIVLYPQYIDKTTAIFMQNVDVAHGAAYFDLALGLLLCYFGWFHGKHHHK